MCDARSYMASNYSPDGLHPNDAGYAFIAARSRPRDHVRLVSRAARQLRRHDDRAVTFSDVVTRLERELRRELPGPEAQARLAPIPRREWPAGFNPARIRNAAGLLLVFPKTTIERRNRRNRRNRRENSDVIRERRSLRALRSLRSRRRIAAHIVLTVRADALRHGGQVSLPGGVVEPGETFEQAALREAHEEVALPLAPVRVLGALTPLDIPVSGFRLHPIVAVTDTPPPSDAG